MNFLIPIAELGNYLMFSFLVGHVALQFVSQENKPKIYLPKPALLLSTLGVIIFSLGPVIQVIFYFKDSVGLNLATHSVLTDFQVGRAWIFIGFMATFLWMTLYVEGSKYLQALLLFLMILAIGYSSHVASLSFLTGTITHTIHFLVVTLWTGILIHVAWFAKEQPLWSKFLKWFTPLASICLIVILVSGLFLMFFVVEPEDYVKAWVLPYGQMLLLKHISIIPVLVFAFINGVLAKRSLSNLSFNPLPWIKTESIFIFLIFYVTGILGTLSPPHEVEFTIKSEGASKLVEWLIGKDISSILHLTINPSFHSIILITLSILFLLLILASFKKVKPILAVLFGISYILAFYLGLMNTLNI
ncbi:copper resistance D family protein [Bacillus sp. CGMCC 1.16607]|uniref:copper resistance D family protein n=1 Tax=Bacillus sp. CGMCC 1.16607 TaxID=3351842 RepID=UPI003626BE55